MPAWPRETSSRGARRATPLIYDHHLVVDPASQRSECDRRDGESEQHRPEQ